MIDVTIPGSGEDLAAIAVYPFSEFLGKCIQRVADSSELTEASENLTEPLDLAQYLQTFCQPRSTNVPLEIRAAELQFSATYTAQAEKSERYEEYAKPNVLRDVRTLVPIRVPALICLAPSVLFFFLAFWTATLIEVGITLAVLGILRIFLTRTEEERAAVRDERLGALQIEKEEAQEEHREISARIADELERDLLLPKARSAINERQRSLSSIRLPNVTAPALGLATSSVTRTFTAEYFRICNLAVTNATACIGISGPRGAGKTTLIEMLGETDRQGNPFGLILRVEAPVGFEARDFLLHLFSVLCTTLAGSDTESDKTMIHLHPASTPSGGVSVSSDALHLS